MVFDKFSNQEQDETSSYFEPKFMVISGALQNDQNLRVKVSYEKNKDLVFTIRYFSGIPQENKDYGLVIVSSYSDIQPKKVIKFDNSEIQKNDTKTIVAKLSNIEQSFVLSIIGQKIQLISFDKTAPNLEYNQTNIILSGTVIFESLFDGKQYSQRPTPLRRKTDAKGVLKDKNAHFDGIKTNKSVVIDCYDKNSSVFDEPDMRLSFDEKVNKNQKEATYVLNGKLGENLNKMILLKSGFVLEFPHETLKLYYTNVQKGNNTFNINVQKNSLLVGNVLHQYLSANKLYSNNDFLVCPIGVNISQAFSNNIRLGNQENFEQKEDFKKRKYNKFIPLIVVSVGLQVMILLYILIKRILKTRSNYKIADNQPNNLDVTRDEPSSIEL